MALADLLTTKQAFLDAQGNPAVGHRLWTYEGGTVNTSKTTYKEADGFDPNTDPIILDSRGELPFGAFSAGGFYKLVFAAPGDTTNPPTSPIWTRDFVSASSDSGGGGGESSPQSQWIAFPGVPTFVSNTSFSLSGDQTSTFYPGQRIRATTAAGLRHGDITRSAFTTITTVTVLLDDGVLDSGLSAIATGLITARSTSAPFVSPEQQALILSMITTTSVRLDPFKGNTAWINQSGFWVRRKIPSGGIAAGVTGVFIDGVASQNLAANITYSEYLFDNAGVLALDFSTTGPSTDVNTGLLIKSGDSTRLFLGTVTTGAGVVFASVSSHYNNTVFDLLETRRVNAVANTDFVITAGMLATYKIFIVNMAPGFLLGGGAANLLLRLSQNAGSTFDAGATDYKARATLHEYDAASGDGGDFGGSSVKLWTSITVNDRASGDFEIDLASGGYVYSMIFQSDPGGVNAPGFVTEVRGAKTVNAAHNAIRLLVTAGSFTGLLRLYGRK